MQKTNIATIKMIHIHNENLIFHSDKHLLMAWHGIIVNIIQYTYTVTEYVQLYDMII